MSKFRYMEYAITTPSNRHYFAESKEVIQKPFQKENRFKEFWRSMFIYQTDNPTEDSPMFGNFYLECDIEEFHKNQEVMLEISSYLYTKYDIPYSFLDFFYTNRSIWLTVPAKVFNCYGCRKLHEIYKKMAEEIVNYLKSKGYNKTLDLSIYKWNGLVHALGSYLAKSKRWVTKFSHSDLENAVCADDILNAKYDNFFTLSDIYPIPKAEQWFYKIKNLVLNNRSNSNKDYSSYFQTCDRVCMKKLEETGTLTINRNLHVYTYALYLKELGYSTKQAIEKIEHVFDSPYVKLRECHRTIKSAIEGNKHFNCKIVKQLLNADLFDCDNCSKSNQKSSFLIPREYIQKLQSVKAHYMCYKLLFEISYHSQVLREPFEYSLVGNKYKKLTLGYFQTLENLGFIKIAQKDNVIFAELVWKKKETYNSHIVVPNSFLRSLVFKEMKNEIKVLSEIWRSSVQVKNKKGVLFFNIKWENLAKKIHMTLKSVFKCLFFLKKFKMIFQRFLFVQNQEKNWKEKLSTLLSRIKNSKIKIKEFICKQVKMISQSLKKNSASSFFEEKTSVGWLLFAFLIPHRLSFE